MFAVVDKSSVQKEGWGRHYRRRGLHPCFCCYSFSCYSELFRLLNSFLSRSLLSIVSQHWYALFFLRPSLLLGTFYSSISWLVFPWLLLCKYHTPRSTPVIICRTLHIHSVLTIRLSLACIPSLTWWTRVWRLSWHFYSEDKCSQSTWCCMH